MGDSIDLTFGGRLRVPVIAAPMFLVSSPQMVIAACGAGVIGSFPAHSTRTSPTFGEWLDEIDEGLTALAAAGQRPAPYAVNLVVHPTNDRYEVDLARCVDRKVAVVLTSKGAPGEVFQEIHSYGGIAFHDVASARHADKALESGADGLIAVCGGAGGHTGTINPFALVSEIRSLTDAPLILAGAINSGRSILAAQVLGADLAYIGTHFIAADESLAVERYRAMLIESSSKDVFFSAALDGAPGNWLIPSLHAAGIDPDDLAVTRPGKVANPKGGRTADRYNGIWSAGHGVGAVTASRPMADIVDQLANDYDIARAEAASRLLRA